MFGAVAATCADDLSALSDIHWENLHLRNHLSWLIGERTQALLDVGWFGLGSCSEENAYVYALFHDNKEVSNLFRTLTWNLNCYFLQSVKK